MSAEPHAADAAVRPPPTTGTGSGLGTEAPGSPGTGSHDDGRFTRARLRLRGRAYPALRRTPVSMWNDDISDYAAALTYYAILAVLPALVVTVVAFGFFSPGTAEAFISHISTWAPGAAGGELHDALVRMVSGDSAAWTVMIAGAASAVWSACSYLAVFRRALHRMHRTRDRRSPLRTAPRIVLTALALLGLLVVSALVLLVSGPIAEAAGRMLSLDATVAVAWSVLRWPLLLCLVSVLVVIVFHTGPPAARRRRYSLPGGVLASVLWLAVSAGFALYTTVLSTYSRLYGSLAGIVVFLIWLWLSNLALLAGAQFTAELARTARAPEPRPATDRRD